MKRFISVISCLALIFGLTACEKSTGVSENASITESVSQTESVTENTPVNEIVPKTQNGELKQLAKRFGNLNYGTRDGYYFFEGQYLKYIDYASASEVFVCPDSSCKHDNEHCTAFFGKEFNIESRFYGPSPNGILFAYGEYMYFLTCPYYHEGSSGNSDNEPLNKGETALYRFNPDGTGREKLYTFDKGEITEFEEACAVGDGNSIWFLMKTPSLIEATTSNLQKISYSGAKNAGLVKFDLETRQIVERIPIEPYNNIALEYTGAYENKFVFCGMAFGSGKSREEVALDGEISSENGKYNYAFFTLDRNNKNIKEIFRSKEPYGWRLFFHVLDNTLYVTSSDNFESVTAVNLDTEEAEIISDGSGYCVAGAYGCEVGGMVRLNKYEDDNSFTCVYDPKQCEMINLDKIPGIFVIFADNGEVIYGELRDEYTGKTISWVLISMEDFLNNNPIYKVIKTESMYS